MKWISVKHQLPESDKKVLAYDSKEGIYTSKYIIEPPSKSYNNGRSWWQFDSGYDTCCHCNDPIMNNVTHWVHLPSPPE